MSTNSLYQSTAYLRDDQYRDSSNLGARAELHRRFSTNRIGWHRWIFDQLELLDGVRLLECGCGPGWLWRENLDRLPSKFEITLTDLSPGMVAEAKEALGNSDHSFAFQEENIESLSFEDGCFDAVVANHMLYHVADRDRAFAEVRRVLRAGGRFFAATNGRNHMAELRQLGEQLLQSLGADIQMPSTQNIAASAFGLENGRSQLEPWFSQVELREYEDSLEVSETEPLLDYIASSSQVRALMTKEIREAIYKHVSQIIGRKGAFHITKATGLFVASI